MAGVLDRLTESIRQKRKAREQAEAKKARKRAQRREKFGEFGEELSRFAKTTRTGKAVGMTARGAGKLAEVGEGLEAGEPPKLVSTARERDQNDDDFRFI